MYILKNAWTSIKRNKGRNILIAIIIIVIACACTVTLAIKNTATSLINSYENAYDVEATIGFNRNNLMQDFRPQDEESKGNLKEEFSNMQALTLDEAINYADSNYVKNYYYTYSINLNSDEIESATEDFGNSFQMEKHGTTESIESSANFTLTGYSSINSMNEFLEGSYTVVEASDDLWDKILNGNYCLINSELADINDLSVGDSITLVDPNNSKNTYEFTILGIYMETESESADMHGGMSLFSNSANKIITNNTSVEEIVASNPDLNATVTPTYILSSFDDVEKFEEELYEKGMNEYFSVTSNQNEVESATKSISNVSSFSMTFLVLTLLIGAIVLFVINLVNVRERKYEIGVLRTIGMKKSLVSCQFMIELLIVAIISLLIGAGIGACISKPISNNLLASEIASSTEQENNIAQNFGGKMPNSDSNLRDNKLNGVVNVSAYDRIDAVVDFKVVAQLLVIGVVLTLISSASSMVVIQRFSPLQILKERS